MELKNKDLFKILQGIDSVGELRGVKFAYAMAKNKRTITAELEDLQKALKESEQYTDYEKKRIELCKKHCIKDDDGNLVMQNNEFQIADKEQFDTEITELKAGYEEAIALRGEQVKEYSELLDKPVNGVAFHKLSLSDLPENISTAQTDMILELIED